MASKTPTFQKDPDETEGFIIDEWMPSLRKPNYGWHNRCALCLFALSGLFLGLSVWVHFHPKSASDQQCLERLNVASPVHDVFEYEDVQFDNAFWKPSPYKGKPTPDLESKWKELWYYGSFGLPDTYLAHLNKSANGTDGNAWARTKSGDLLAGLEVFHNLHCLNLIRQYTHRFEYDYSDDPAFHGDEELVLADVTPFLHTTGSRGIQPDFDSQHRCPKYDRIIQWAKERQIMVEHP
ncbi:hypothetical protein CT0861_06664 [Colletotrichum tofieldiae]|uniref:Tat pathway signal sequence n=1 Tax=Colletotrichum tofieldiae TaxID=708197 RepID=A0A166ME13_9PEZI|nr:hypothetical protein CT0861_06664 [Colletotrichum tofieldiae]